MKEKESGEDALAFQIRVSDLPEPEREYRWAVKQVGPGRGLRKRLAAAGLQDWRFDFAWPELGVAVEVEGGVWSGGRHVRGAGYAADCKKYREAQLHGWIVLRFPTWEAKDGTALGVIERALELRALGVLVARERGGRNECCQSS